MPLNHRQDKALLVLEDGSVYEGKAFAGVGEAFGEVVFNTAMTGYQEVLTDPSYTGQILLMTYPLIGSCGINDEDMEAKAIYTEAFVVREYQRYASNWRANMTLEAFLEQHGRLGIEGIDTRAVTRRIRTQGALKGGISTLTHDARELLERVRACPGLVGRDLVAGVTNPIPSAWGVSSGQEDGAPPRGGAVLRVVVLDCGVKFTILRCLERLGCEVRVVPATTTAPEILALKPDGVLLSNGPGDPAPLGYAVATVRGLLGQVPIFGICLGHQLLGQALGGSTGKLRFGHHGVNQPVKNLLTGRVEITSQNHGFVVLTDTLPAGAEVTHINLNDGTLEGLRMPSQMAFSVQYHPEAAPGPVDAHYLFEDFMQLMRDFRGTTDGAQRSGPGGTP